MPNGSLMEMMGYEAGGLQELFGQYFQDVDPRWSQYFEPQFETTRTALGELPGLRGGMLEQLRGGLQRRGVEAGRALRGRQAGAGFAGAGAFGREARTARRGLGEEYGRGMWGIEQDIARKRAGLLGGLRGEIGGFLGQLMAADVGGREEPGRYDESLYRQYTLAGGDMSYLDWINAGRPTESTEFIPTNGGNGDVITPPGAGGDDVVGFGFM